MNEIKKGSYILADIEYNTRICKVTGFMQTFDKVKIITADTEEKREYILPYKNLRPLPLTKEMLLVNGWKKWHTLIPWRGYFHKDGWRLYPCEPIGWMLTAGQRSISKFCYIHELQQLLVCISLSKNKEHFKFENFDFPLYLL